MSSDENTESPLDVLLSKPLDDRIEAIWQDVSSRKDIFREIDFFDLVDALKVPLEDLRGSEWLNWGCFVYQFRLTLEDYIKEYDVSLGDLLDELKDSFEVERFSRLKILTLETQETSVPSFSFLSKDERVLITEQLEKKLFENDFDEYSENVNFYSLTTESGGELEFQVADNGYEWYNTGTPYEQRDGLFIKLDKEVIFYCVNDPNCNSFTE